MRRDKAGWVAEARSFFCLILAFHPGEVATATMVSALGAFAW